MVDACLSVKCIPKFVKIGPYGSRIGHRATMDTRMPCVFSFLVLAMMFMEKFFILFIDLRKKGVI